MLNDTFLHKKEATNFEDSSLPSNQAFPALLSSREIDKAYLPAALDMRHLKGRGVMDKCKLI